MLECVAIRTVGGGRLKEWTCVLGSCFEAEHERILASPLTSLPILLVVQACARAFQLGL